MSAAKSTAAGTATQEPTSAAARRAAGLPDAEPDTAASDSTTAVEEGLETVGRAVPAGAVTSHPGGDSVSVDNLTEEELATIRLLRSSRGQEVMDRIKGAPVGVGTEADPYTLYHLHGCPDPDHTEIYPAKRPDGREVTVIRCLECGAQNNVDH